MRIQAICYIVWEANKNASLELDRKFFTSKTRQIYNKEAIQE